MSDNEEYGGQRDDEVVADDAGPSQAEQLVTETSHHASDSIPADAQVPEQPEPAIAAVSASGILPSVPANGSHEGQSNDVDPLDHARVTVAPLVALVAAPLVASVPPLVSEFERGRLAGLAAASQSQVELRAPGITSLPQGSPQIGRPVNRALFVPPIGSIQGAIRPQVFDAMLPEGRLHANVLDPGYATIDPSGLPPALGASIGGLSALVGTFRNRATAMGIANAEVAVPTVADPCPGAIPGNPAWILGGLASASPGGSNGLSLTDVPALLDNMNLGSNPSTRNPVKYLSVVSQYCRGKEYHGMQLHLTPAENRSAYLTYRYLSLIHI